MIANLIRNLTGRETNSRNRTSPRRALKPSVDSLETRLSPGGGWTSPTTYTPTPTTPKTPTTMPWKGTLTPQVTTTFRP